MKVWSLRSVAAICAAALAVVATLTVSPFDQGVRTDDRNFDGRPDVWRHYNKQGQLTEVTVDSNFDGRSDIQEYYDRGVLIRRESDRNFDDQVDAIDEYDATTHQQIRSVVDLDFDGLADVLVLFRDGQPAFFLSASSEPRAGLVSTEAGGTSRAPHSPRKPRGPRAGRSGTDPLEPLVDPFERDAAIRATHTGVPGMADVIGLSTSGGLPSTRFDIIGSVAPSVALVGRNAAIDASAARFPRPVRGPPLS